VHRGRQQQRVRVMPKARGQNKRKMLRHDPLATQIEESSLRAEGPLRPVRGDNDEPRVDGSAAVEEVVLGRARRKQALKKKKRVAQTLVVDKKEYVSAKMTRKILQQAREQQDDEQRQEEQIDDDDAGDDGAGVGGIDGTSTELFPALGSIQEGVEQEGGDEEGDRGDAHSAGEKEEAHAAGEETSFEYLDEGQISAEDERILAMFRPGGSGGPEPKAKTLSDYIMEKIHEKEEGAVADGTISATPAVSSLDPKVVEVFKGVGRCGRPVVQLPSETLAVRWRANGCHARAVTRSRRAVGRRVLEKHRSGQLPKAFKIIPTLRNWEEVGVFLH
jgi:essential nuclear protein 1